MTTQKTFRPEKIAMLEEYRKGLMVSDFALVTAYHGLSSAQLSELRSRLQGIGTFIVVRNSLFKKAAEQAGYGNIGVLVDGPVGIITGKEIVSVIRILCKFVEEYNLPVIKGGIIKERLLDAETIQQIAKLPSEEVLRGQLVGTLAAPMIKVVYVLKNRMSSLVFVLKAYIETKVDKK